MNKLSDFFGFTRYGISIDFQSEIHSLKYPTTILATFTNSFHNFCVIVFADITFHLVISY